MTLRIPGCPLGRSLFHHIFYRDFVVRPAFPIAEVFVGKLPAFERITYSILEPANLLASPFERLSCRLLKGSERKLAPMTVSSPNVIEIKVDRLIDDMRLLRSQMIAFDRQLKGIEASLKPSEPSEQQPESKPRPWFVAAASATARTVLILFAVGAATTAALLYLGT
jgi:hypothetical protein